jgi:hypothetical protein
MGSISSKKRTAISPANNLKTVPACRKQELKLYELLIA